MVNNKHKNLKSPNFKDNPLYYEAKTRHKDEFFIREGFKKKKILEFSNTLPTPPTHPLYWKKNKK